MLLAEGKGMSSFSLAGDYSALEPTANRLIRNLQLTVFINNSDNEQCMISAGQFNARLGMAKNKGIVGRFAQQLRWEVGSGSQGKHIGNTDGPQMDRQIACLRCR